VVFDDAGSVSLWANGVEVKVRGGFDGVDDGVRPRRELSDSVGLMFASCDPNVT